MIAYGINWPSIAEDSEILRQRVAPQLRLLTLKARLAEIFERAA